MTSFLLLIPVPSPSSQASALCLSLPGLRGGRVLFGCSPAHDGPQGYQFHVTLGCCSATRCLCTSVCFLAARLEDDAVNNTSNQPFSETTTSSLSSPKLSVQTRAPLVSNSPINPNTSLCTHVCPAQREHSTDTHLHTTHDAYGT